jgi:16S rRNA (guanine527-N7)-methyltransferase
LVQPDQVIHIEIPEVQVHSLVAEYLDTIGYAADRISLVDRIERYGAMIALWGSRMNLTAEANNPQEIAFHIIDSLSPVILADSENRLRDAFRTGNQVLDLGSGAGFPGLVLASASPATFTLTESRRKRASFLVSAAAEMRLKNVVVESKRIVPQRSSSSYPPTSAQRGASGRFDVVTARAFAAPSTFHLTAASVLRPGGVAILYGNVGQDLALSHAEQNDLCEFRSIAYTIPRGSRLITRILGLWQRRQTK